MLHPVSVLNQAARKELTAGRLAHLVTINADGSPQVSPVWIGLDGDEIVVGLGNGVACGLVGWMVVWIWKGDVWLGAILCAAMIINMFVAATAGTLVPLGLRAANIDPALASSVFITTLTDVFGFLSFLGLATLFMRYLTAG